MGGPRKNNFSRAREEAKRRLKQAIAERDRSQKALARLSKEIPDLQRTIQALEIQLGKPLSVQKAATTQEVDRYISDPELAVLAGPQDLTGMGSTREVASHDEDLLPDAEGEPLVPE